MNYPKDHNLIKQKIAGIAFIDNQLTFNSISKDERSLLFSADNHHCNSQGYKIIAKNLFNYITNNIVTY